MGMTDTLITFETAVLAKERGFKPEKQWNPEYVSGYIVVDKLTEFQEEDYCLQDHYLAPTQSILCRWLRETHKKYIVIHPSFDTQVKWVFSIQDDKGVTKWGQDSELSLLQFKTYEDAMESALVDALGMIE